MVGTAAHDELMGELAGMLDKLTKNHGDMKDMSFPEWLSANIASAQIITWSYEVIRN